MDYTLTITGFKNGWQNADVTPGLETLDATGIETMTLDPSINPEYGLIAAVTTLKFKGAIAADFTVPAGTATITTLDLTGITGTKAVKLGDMSSYSALETVTFGTLAAEIGAGAFSGHTAIKTVTLGGDTKIGENAFKDATNLETITMAKATEIGAYAFESTKISEINLAAAKKIGNNAFQNTTVTEVTIPAQVETIADAAFYNINGLTTVTINLDNDVATTIGAWFNGGSIATLTINTPKVTKIAGSAFAASPISELTITAPLLEEIGSSAFAAYANTELDLSGLTALKTVANDVFSKNAYTSVKLEGTALDNDNFVNAQAWLAGSKASLTEITLPAAITELGGFKEFTALESITIPAAVTKIKDEAFSKSGLKTVAIPAGVTEIGTSAFEYTPLESVDFTGASALTTIGAYAFYQADKLTTVAIPATVTTIGADAFENCSLLATVDFSAAAALTTIGEKAFKQTPMTTIDLTGATALTTVAATAFPANAYTEVLLDGTALDNDGFSTPFTTILANSKASLAKITLPAGLTKIKDNQFEEFEALEAISLPKAVTTIGASAFKNSGLKGIKFKKNVVTIGESAFQSCDELANVNLSEATALTTIGVGAFADCPKLAAIDFAGATALTTISDYAFANSALTTVKVTGSIETIGTNAFYDNKLESVDFSEAAALTTIGPKAFGVTNAEDSKITVIDLTGATALTSVADNAFPGTNAYTSVLLAGTALEGSAITNVFSQNNILHGSAESLTEITFPAGYDIANFNEFDYFTNLTAIALPEGTTVIPANAFAGANITSFKVPATVTKIGANAFAGSTLESIDFSEAAALEEIETKAFSNTKLTSLDFAGATALTTVGSDAFEKNNELASVDLSGATALETLGEGMFENCAGLESVKIPATVTVVNHYAFSGCSSLESVDFSEATGMTTIQTKAFNGTKLTVIDLSAATALTKVANDAFPQNEYTSVKTLGTALAGIDPVTESPYDNYSEPFSTANILANAQPTLAEVTLPEGLTEIGASQFEGFTAIESIGLPKSVEIINEKAFYKATALKSIKIRDNVTNINTNAFAGCESLASVNMEKAKSLKYIGVAAFGASEYNPAKKDAPAITSIVIPATVTRIDNGAFYNCEGLADLDLSQAAALQSIGVDAFFGTALTAVDFSACAKLTNIETSSFPANGYKSVKFNGSQLDEAEIQDFNLSGAKATLKEVTLPGAIKAEMFNGIATVPSYMFSQQRYATTLEDQKPFSALKSVTIPKSVETIGQYAFEGSALTAIKIRPNVQKIDEFAFAGCENLATADFSETTNLQFINESAFAGTALTEVIIPANEDVNLQIGASAFSGIETLKKFSAPSWIGDENNDVATALFAGDVRLKDINIPAAIKGIGDDAFAGCAKLATVTFHYGKKDAGLVHGIGDFAFAGCETLEALDLSTTKLAKIDSNYPFAGCTALATVTFPEELTVINSDALFADCAIENFEAPNLTSTTGVLFGKYSTFDDDGHFDGYSTRNKENTNTTLKTVKMSGNIPEGCFAFCTSLESVEWLGVESVPDGSIGSGSAMPSYAPGQVKEGAFAYCTALKTFTYLPELPITKLMVSDDAFVGCTPYVMFVTNRNYLDWIVANYRGAAPVNATFGDNIDITKVKTVQDKANAKQFVGKYVNNSATPVYIDANEAKAYSIYVDGDAAYFQACRTFNGYYIIEPQMTYDPDGGPDGSGAWSGTRGWGSHVILKTDEAKEIEIHQLTMTDAIKLDLARYFMGKLPISGLRQSSIAYDDVYDSQKDDDLARVQHYAGVSAGSYLYRLTNTAGQGFGFTAFTGSTIKEGQFFVACEAKPAGAGRLAEVWLDEDGKVISGDVTGIESVEKIDVNNGAIYNLQGVRVDNPVKGGLYIQNGKKIVVK